MSKAQFEGEIYNDDRMFVLHLCKCTVDDGPEETSATTIYHESAPPEHRVCLVTYRNTLRYPAVRVDHFDSLEEARAYMERVEPTVPRVSLKGRGPAVPLSYEQWSEWKKANNLPEYDYKTMYTPGGSNPREVVISKRR